MNFDLVTPCKDCPFLSTRAPFITAARAREIVTGITTNDQTFACHKTVTHGDDGEHIPKSTEQHCAGALIFLERMDRPNQMMRIAERVGGYDRRKLNMDAPVFLTARAMVDHMKGSRR